VRSAGGVPVSVGNFTEPSLAPRASFRTTR
jgi:hypothetical protein